MIKVDFAPMADVVREERSALAVTVPGGFGLGLLVAQINIRKDSHSQDIREHLCPWLVI